MERMNQRILVACNIFAILFFISSCKNIKPLKDTTAVSYTHLTLPTIA